MATILEEGRLRFAFEGDAVKFDAHPFYRDFFNHQPEGKGVDFVALANGKIVLLEVKDCAGYEVENHWRIGTDNRLRDKLLSRADASKRKAIANRDSFDIEMAKKVSSTISCLYGSWTKAQTSEKAEDMAPFWNWFTNESIPACDWKILAILFLEGDFRTQSPKSDVMQKLQESIAKKLRWLNCQVSLIDSNTVERHHTAFTLIATRAGDMG